MIELKDIYKSYKDRKGNINPVLKNVNISFEKTGMTIILGKSGSGKSTLLNVIGGLDNYDSGELILFGKNSKEFKEKEFDNYRNNYMGFVFQDFNIIEDYTVYENIILPLKLQNNKINNNELDDLLEKLEIKELKYRKVNELSGGQKQRVAIARALIKKPKVILADEPTGNLDSKTGIEVMNLLKDISKDTLVIVVSHNEEYAKSYADRVIEIRDGIIFNDTNPIKKHSSNDSYSITKTKLPLIDSLKFGFSFLKCKKIKLFFTILLISFSTLFLSMSYIVKKYNLNENHYNMLNSNNIDYIEIKKSKDYGNHKVFLSIDKEDLNNISDKLNSKYNVIYKLNENSNIIDFFKLNIYQQKDLFNDVPAAEKDLYTIYSSSVKIVETSSIEDLPTNKLIGKYPSADDEIIISNYLADLIISNGIYEYDNNQIFKPKNYDNIISSNKYFNFGKYNKVKIVGIIEYDVSKFQPLKGLYQKSNIKNITSSDLKLNSELSLYTENIYNRVYVNSQFIRNVDFTQYNPTLIQSNIYKSNYDNNSINSDRINVINHNVEYYDGNKWVQTDTLDSNQMIISILDIIGASNYNSYVEELNNYIKMYPYRNALELEKEFILEKIDFSNIIGKNVTLKIYEDTEILLPSDDITPTKSYNNIAIIGVAGLINSGNVNNLFSMNILEEYTDNYIKADGILLSKLTKNELKKYFNIFGNDKDYYIYSLYSITCEFYNNFIKSIGVYINLATIIFFAFSFILICNFMFNSINAKKKDIGILKSLGAKNKDVIKIFIFEDILLSILSSILSITLLVIIFNFVNSTILSSNIDLVVSPFYVDFNLVVVTFIYILTTIILSSLIPIIKISKMKPIDAILNK